ncbi:MAG: hypothetical protein AAF938_26115 [Myxococcota bacterium]
MTIAALRETAIELRRLTIAGSPLARGDFRLKKLVPVLQQTGKKAAVFATIAGALETLLESPKAQSAQHLLRATTLVNAVLATQLKHRVKGELVPLEAADLHLSNRPVAAKTMRAILEALSSTGSGRLEVIQEGHRSGYFRDLRLMLPALRALDDRYSELAEFIEQEVLPTYGRAILPHLQRAFAQEKGYAQVRRLRLMLRLMGDAERRALCIELAESDVQEVRAAAAGGLAGGGATKELFVLAKDRAHEVRAAAYGALATEPDALDFLAKAIPTQDGQLASAALATLLAQGVQDSVTQGLAEQADAYLANVLERKKAHHLRKLLHWLRALAGDTTGPGIELLLRVAAQRAALSKLPAAVKADIDGRHFVERLDELLATCGDERATEMLLERLDLKAPRHAFEASVRTRSPAFVYDTFHAVMARKRRDRELLSDQIVCGYDEGLPPRGDVAWDPRWLDLALARNDRLLAFMLLTASHGPAIQYAEDIASDPKDHESGDALRALRDAGYARWSSLLDRRIAAQRTGRHSTKTYWSDQRFLESFPFEALSDQELADAEAHAAKMKGSAEAQYTTRMAEERFRRRTSTKGS